VTASSAWARRKTRNFSRTTEAKLGPGEAMLKFGQWPFRLPSRLVMAAIGLTLLADPVLGHDTGNHAAKDQVETPTEAAVGPVVPPEPNPFPFQLGGPFVLIDHFGRVRTPDDFKGKFQLVVFGYAQCKNMCPLSLARLAGALDSLGETGEKLQPLFITVNPEVETPALLRATLEKIHPRILGLSGSPTQVDQALAGFRIKREEIGPDLEGDPIVSHSSFMYLMGPDGDFLTFLPPIFPGPQLADKLRPYLMTADAG